LVKDGRRRIRVSKETENYFQNKSVRRDFHLGRGRKKLITRKSKWNENEKT